MLVQVQINSLLCSLLLPVSLLLHTDLAKQTSVFERLVRHFIYSTGILGRNTSCRHRRPGRNVMQRHINLYVRPCSAVLRTNQMLQDQVLCSHAGAPIVKRRAMIRSWYRSLPNNVYSS